MRLIWAVLLSFTTTLFAQTERPKTFLDESNAWHKTHTLPANASPEQRRVFNEELADATAQWVNHWPDDPRAWLARLHSLVRLKSTSDQQLEQVGDTLLQVLKEHPVQGFRFVPVQTEVPEIWSMRKIRLEQCLQLTQEAARKDKQAQSDNPSLTRQLIEVIAQGLFRTLGMEAFLAIDLKKFDVAESALDEMKQYCDEHPDISDRLKHLYLADAAVIANSEGHKPDALLYYSEAFREYPDDSSTETHARQLWKDLGGSDEGFNAWTAAVARMDRPAPASKQGGSLWTPINKPLTAFHGVDTSRKIWTFHDLKGKTTLVNVWATWCRPCQEELPDVQAIFDQLKDRKDVQVLTVSVDQDFSWVARFAERQHYTFPIIGMASADVDKMVGIEGVPRTWIVDSTGSVRFELVGYDHALWPTQILQQLDAVK
ncbi:MAG TPA: TlpA disulfide reductase family protein [Bryobacteraceae bacterium]|nr:TlpA disulfide reductase family protein [Bryobacteraceae bacterium]